jgi:S1-C subfamily serine protease
VFQTGVELPSRRQLLRRRRREAHDDDLQKGGSLHWAISATATPARIPQFRGTIAVVIQRALILLLFAMLAPLPAQEVRVLRIKITVTDAEGRNRPVPRHALLISENPASAAPRRVVTSLEGTADVRLRPGNYTIESDEPLVFQGRSYQWIQTLDVPPGRDTTLDLVAANAEVEDTSRSATMAAGQSSPSELLMAWQESVVNLWSATARGAGFVLDRRGLILTSERVVGASETVEVQFTATKKVRGHVLAADRAKNVAVIRIDPSLVASLPPAKLDYREGATPVLAEGQDVFAIDASVLDQKRLASGRVTRVDARMIETDVLVDDATSGVPILTATGAIIGITSKDSRGQREVVPIDEARTVIAAAEKKMGGAAAPAATPLPVEPRPPSNDAWKEAAPKRIGNLGPYQFSASDFDVTFITPLLNHVVHHPPERTTGASKAGGTQDMSDLDPSRRALEDFGNWTEYVDEIPPVLFIRATPKLKESFWATIGRAAASTQGISLPAFKKMKDSFASMRVYCGQTEVTPIHPFRIERRLDANTGMFEGLYVFVPESIGPHCGEVKLLLFSEKAPGRGDERVIDAKILEQLARDFAAVR